jgi:hypothetical protein
MMRGKLRIMENHLHSKRGIIENAYTSFEVNRFFNIPHLGYNNFAYTPFFSSKIYPVLNYYFKCIYIFYRKNILRLWYIFNNKKKYTPNGVYFFCASITMMRNFWHITVSYFLSRKITHHGCTQVIQKNKRNINQNQVTYLYRKIPNSGHLD